MTQTQRHIHSASRGHRPEPRSRPPGHPWFHRAHRGTSSLLAANHYRTTSAGFEEAHQP